MHKAIWLAVLFWCATGLGGIAQADPPVMFDSDPLFIRVGLLSPESHQQLLALLGESALRVIDPMNASSLPAAASPYDLAMIAQAPDAPPRRVPEPGMFTLLTLIGVALFCRRHPGLRRGNNPLTR